MDLRLVKTFRVTLACLFARENCRNIEPPGSSALALAPFIFCFEVPFGGKPLLAACSRHRKLLRVSRANSSIRDYASRWCRRTLPVQNFYKNLTEENELRLRNTQQIVLIFIRVVQQTELSFRHLFLNIYFQSLAITSTLECSEWFKTKRRYTCTNQDFWRG